MEPPIIIDSILGGIGPLDYFCRADQFLSSIGIDPDMPIDDSAIHASGLIRPTSMAKFSSTEITGAPLWIITNPKTTNTYVYANDGKVHLVDSSLAMGTALNSGNALTTASGNGAAYYDNYLYFATNTDITRYGPLNGSPSLSQVYWATTLSKAALANTTYPTIHGVALPNHVMHRHTDNKLYFADVVGNQGVLHYIRTRKTSVEGDTDDTSTYNALDFPYGYYPTAIASYGVNLVVALMEGTDTTIKQKHAKLSFWNTTDSSYSLITDEEFPDPIITAIHNVNGILYVFSGNASGGYRVTKYAGGYSGEEIYYSEDGMPPLPGAVDHELNRIIWGGFVSDPEAAAVVFSWGSKKKELGTGLNVPFKSTSAGTTQAVTALKYLEHASNSKLRPVIGWSDGSAKGLDKISTTYGVAVFRGKRIRFKEPVIIRKVTMPLMQAVAANMTVTPKIYVDGASNSTALKVINNTNFAASERHYVDYPQIVANTDIFLELRNTGTALLTIGLPIYIYFEYLNK